MTGLIELNHFIESSRAVGGDDELAALVDAQVRDLGFDYFSLLQVDVTPGGTRSRIKLSSYPQVWIERVTERRYFSEDPVYLASCRTAVGFRVDRVGDLIELTPRHRLILAEARRAGVGEGFAVPAHVPGEANGIASFMVRTGRSLPGARLPAAQLVGSFAYEAARRLRAAREGPAAVAPARLTARQVECVLLVARGKTDWEIARILGITEDTVTEHLDEARRRCDVSRRTQLVVRALFDGHFTIADALH